MTQIGSVYGEALYSLASEEKLDTDILQQLLVLEQSISQEPDFVRLMVAPNLSKEERCGILDESFRGKVHEYVLNFMKILTEKGYFRHFSACVRAYRERYNEAHNILTVTAVTAVALTAGQSQKLSEKLSKLTGKRIELVNQVDPACMGGVCLDYDGKRVDDTVSNRLPKLGSLLKNTVL
jgi:F-type H+-transporting ATPase subunit delta